MNLKKIFLYVLIASVALSAVIGIGVILFGSFGELETRILLTTFTITCTSILGLACGAYFEAKRARNLPFAGIFFSIVSAGLCIYMIWFGDRGIEAVWKLAATTAMLATACGHLSLISLATLDKKFMWSRLMIYVSAAVLVSILLVILWLEPDSSSDLVSRLIGILAIVIAALTVITPVFHRLSTAAPTPDKIDAEITKLRAEIVRLEETKARAERQP